MSRYTLFVAAAIFLCCPQAGAQTDSFPESAKHCFARATGELLLAGVAPFLFDRYLTRQDYARISWQTVGHNLSPAHWEWDYDGFQTNQFGHPYHGSLYFNAFRSNGYSFWQSLPAAFAGSYLWETFAENQAPAPNDFINTGFGGVILGETTHRLAGKLVNNNSRGLKRQVAEVLALLINPMNGFDRILSGRWGRPVLCYSGVSTGSCPIDDNPLRMEFDAGLRKYNPNGASPFHDGRYGVYARLRLQYGDPAKGFHTPFSHLAIVAEAGQDDSSAINVVTVYGSLSGWNTRLLNGSQTLVLSANYDYFHNTAFLFSAQSIRANLFTQFPMGAKTAFHLSLGAGPVLLAAVPNTYLFHSRNYDYGPGLAYNSSGRLDIADRVSVSLLYRGGWMKTINGNGTHYFLHAVTNEISLRILPECSISGELGYFILHGNYLHFNPVDKTYPYLRLSVRYDPFFP